MIHSAGKSKVSPPPPEDVPLQYSRPNMEVLEAFELSPENQSRPLDVAVRPKYPRQELRVVGPVKHYVVEQKQHRATRRFVGALVSVVLTAASMHILVINHVFEGILLNSGGDELLSKQTNYLRSKLRSLFKAYPRTFFLEDHVQPVKGRKIVQYSAEFSDATQLYDTKNSDDAAIMESMERKFFPEHETNKDCVPMSESQKSNYRKRQSEFPTSVFAFTKLSHSIRQHCLTSATCNNVHALGMGNSLEDDSLRFLSNAGSWRDAWRFKAEVVRSPNEKEVTDNVILKTIKFEHPLEDRYFEFSRVDALAMEHLTNNPYVMNVHDFCGVSVITERGEDTLGKVVQRLSPRAKVDLAVKVALSVAAVHEMYLVHYDINADNIFMGTKNNPKLNDFNIAILMMKNNSTNNTCPFVGHFPNEQWKSPEEQIGPDGIAIGDLNEKVDIYALGNLLFQLATDNKRPWRDMADSDGAKLTPEQKAQVSHLKMEGQLPKVPEKTLKLNDPYINLLLEAMEQCYRFKPEDRPTAREVAEFLETRKKTLDDNLVEFGRFPKSTSGISTKQTKSSVIIRG